MSVTITSIEFAAPTGEQAVSLRRAAGWTAIISAPVAIISIAVILSGAEWNSAIFEDATVLLGYGPDAATAARAGMVLDVLGYYALLVPAILLLCRCLRRRDPGLGAVAQVGGLAYVVVGATGAAMLAAVWPSTLEQVAGADATQSAALSASFDAVTQAVVKGMWNLIGSAALAVMLLIAARLLWSDRRAFAVMSLVVGMAAAADAFATAIGADDLASVPLQVYLYGLPVWAVWLGIMALRGDAALMEVDRAVAGT